MNSFLDTSHLFSSYSAEHFVLLIGFVTLVPLFFRVMASYPEETQRRVLLGLAVLLSLSQLMKIPLNLYAGTFDVSKDIPLHLCNYLPFVLVWMYASKNRKVWATLFFWIVLGTSQANFTPSVEFSLFHYDAIRYWMVHLGLVLLALYPAVAWKWDLHKEDIYSTVIWLNVAAAIVFAFNLLLGTNYMYLMAKPPGTTFYSILPAWPAYILVLEVILITWSLLVYRVFRWFRREPVLNEQLSG